MRKTTQIRILWICCLVFAFSTGSQQLRSFAGVRINAISTPTQNEGNNSASYDRKLSPLAEAKNKFSVSVYTFISELNKLDINQQSNNAVNSQNVISELDKLETIIITLDHYNKSDNTIVNNILSDIRSIRKSLIPLISGVNKSSIAKLMESQVISDFPYNQGNFDQNLAKVKIEDYLFNQNQKIQEEIHKLEKSINSEKITNTPSSGEITPPINQDNDNQSNSLLRYSLYVIVCLLFFFMGGLAGILATFLWEKKQKSQKNPPLNPTHNKSAVPPHQANWSTPPTGLKQEPYTRTHLTEINPPTTSQPTYQPTYIERTQPTDIPTQPPVNYPHSSDIFASPEERITTEYNQNPKQVCKNAIEVSETAYSINQRREGTNQSVILEKASKNKGNYCIVPEQGYSYLLPKENLKINEFNYETVTILFDFYNYQPGGSTDFKLRKPAIVVAENQDLWILQEKGELLF